VVLRDRQKVDVRGGYPCGQRRAGDALGDVFREIPADPSRLLVVRERLHVHLGSKRNVLVPEVEGTSMRTMDAATAANVVRVSRPMPGVSGSLLARRMAW
jgi:hypothetical protein